MIEQQYLILSALIFAIGLMVIATRRNAIMMLMGVELMLNAANINFVGMSQYDQTGQGVMFAIFVIVIAAAEAAVGLALVLQIYRHYKSVDMDSVKELREK